LPASPCGPRPPGQPAAARATDPAAARATDTAAWNRFALATDDTIADVADVPWPSTGEPLPGALSFSAAMLKVAVRDLQRRWHPDKFMQRFGVRLLPEIKDEILRKVVAVTQLVNAISI
jgi:hypothetical protein